MPEEKKKYADYVTLTEKEYNTLVSDFGQKLTDRFIDKLDNYKGARPKKRVYTSDYRAILSWVVGAETGKSPAELRESMKKESELLCKYCGRLLRNERINHAKFCYRCGKEIENVEREKTTRQSA